jgi:hypothetical protein
MKEEKKNCFSCNDIKSISFVSADKFERARSEYIDEISGSNKILYKFDYISQKRTGVRDHYIEFFIPDGVPECNRPLMDIINKQREQARLIVKELIQSINI